MGRLRTIVIVVTRTVAVALLSLTRRPTEKDATPETSSTTQVELDMSAAATSSGMTTGTGKLDQSFYLFFLFFLLFSRSPEKDSNGQIVI